MKKIIILLAITLFIGCDSTNEDCECYKYPAKLINQAKSMGKIKVCHNGKTLEINQEDLDTHINHGDAEGSCGPTLGIDDYNLNEPTFYSINCEDDGLEDREINGDEYIVICK